LPLPIFVRGDDIEYGCRLKGQGFHTLVPPGIAIWHEPFDAKSGGWQSYFATRNFLIAAACHERSWARKASSVVLRRVVSSLLSCDYYEAWLHCEAVADFLTGPSILEADATAVLRKLASGRPTSRKQARAPGMRPLPLRKRFLFSRRLRKLERRWQMVRHWVSPVSRAAKSHAEGFVAAPHGSWWNLASRDCFLLERPFSVDLEVRCRDPRAYRRLVARVLALRRRLRHEEAQHGAIWRQHFPELTSARAWEKRLGMVAPESTGIRPEARHPAESTAEARR
jgi:galactofuranosylgalactofuranosylrhamnosyl-N-acetylglucosaminyl-diphospho-decaprenol beta-1,5/1,6-galactofuranosyltransferase